MQRRVIATAPTRIDLAGGTLDLWPIHNLIEDKLTVNCGIGLTARTEIVLASDGVWKITSLDQGKAIANNATCVCASTCETTWRRSGRTRSGSARCS